MKRSVIGIYLTCAMAVIIGVTAIIGINAVDSGYFRAGETRESLVNMAKILEYIRRLEALPYIALDAGNEESYGAIPVLQDGNDMLAAFESYLDSFDITIVTPEVRKMFDEAKAVYFNEYKPLLSRMQEIAYAGEDMDSLRVLIEPMKLALIRMSENCNECMYIVYESARQSEYENSYTVETISVIIIVLIVMEIILSVIFLILTRKMGNKYISPAKNGNFPVYAMYPVDPSNPASPPNATHIMYPIIYPLNPAQPDEPWKYQE